ncbi:MAG: 2-oxoglutarate dehydrogenase complex dihydrolipoyllysine-residue succinyltransferase [Bacteroidia bacterium]|nr:2-oxoglutarate dehydrogenase complex dihydrolipoyllysine-residue succinyltransferase [Bacteroidia bacterium]
MIVDVKVPSPGESITEVEIESWLIAQGTVVTMDQELAEINSDKATLTINAPAAGKIELLAAAGDTVAVGQVVARIDTEAVQAQSPAPQVSPVQQDLPAAEKVAESGGYAKGVTSPAAEKLIKDKGLDPAQIAGTGRDGRITKTDVVTHTPAPRPEPVRETPKADKPAPAPVPAGERRERREKMSSLRRRIADRLVSVKNETAMLTTFNEVDLYQIMELRKKYKDKFKEVHGVGLGFMSFFTKACSMALLEFPGVNAQIQGQEILYFDYVDMGIAVSTERGLVVPVIRNAHEMSLVQIEKAVLAYALKARDNKITPDDMAGGTFTITNGGVFGSMLSTPILNPPQSAILGMHNIVERPVALGGEVKIRPIMYVALSYDHRIIDGKEAVSFLVRVKERLEDPSRMLLEL